MKICSQCGVEKSNLDFSKGKHTKDGFRPECKLCQKRASPEKNRASQKRWREANLKKARANSRDYSVRWAKENPEKHAANQAARRAMKLNRTPSWADLEAIKEFYEKCPEGHHVDHEIPLQGKTVSGLHVENNLRHITAEENLSKGNKF